MSWELHQHFIIGQQRHKEENSTHNEIIISFKTKTAYDPLNSETVSMTKYR